MNPVTGAPMKASSLIPLHYYRNAEGILRSKKKLTQLGKFHCPISSLVFTDHSHIIAIKTTGNVYSFKAVDKLNIQKKNWHDLITGEVFTRADIISLQDPQNPEVHDPSTFYFVKNGLTAMTKTETSSDPLKNIVMTSTSERIYKEMKEKDAVKKAKKDQEEAETEIVKNKSSGPTIETKEKSKYRGVDAASFTSSAFTPKRTFETGWKPKKTTDKGYVRVVTNKGNLNFQLHCDLAPLACENFLTHSENEYFKYCKFHRNIKNFMLQGGDPTATGKGGASIWGRSFPDEIVSSLKFEGEGVLAMANSGKDTNNSQFFITYKSAPHLNGRHTVFGKLVGGSEVLKELAEQYTDEQDRPLDDLMILQTIVYKNPFCDEEMELQVQVLKDIEKKESEKEEYGAWLSNVPKKVMPTANEKVGSGIGKYISSSGAPKKPQKRALDFGTISEPSKKKPRTAGYGDFSNF